VEKREVIGAVLVAGLVWLALAICLAEDARA
jgi:hypothetical protein